MVAINIESEIKNEKFNDSPKFWLIVMAASVVIHVLTLWILQLLIVGQEQAKKANVPGFIEIITTKNSPVSLSQKTAIATKVKVIPPINSTSDLKSTGKQVNQNITPVDDIYRGRARFQLPPPASKENPLGKMPNRIFPPDSLPPKLAQKNPGGKFKPSIIPPSDSVPPRLSPKNPPIRSQKPISPSTKFPVNTPKKSKRNTSAEKINNNVDTPVTPLSEWQSPNTFDNNEQNPISSSSSPYSETVGNGTAANPLQFSANSNAPIETQRTQNSGDQSNLPVNPSISPSKAPINTNLSPLPPNSNPVEPNIPASTESSQGGMLVATLMNLGLPDSRRDIPDQTAKPVDRQKKFDSSIYYPLPQGNKLKQAVDVLVYLGIDETGKVDLATSKIITGSGNAEADQMAMDLLKDWRFQPAKQGGKPVYGELKVNIQIVPHGA